MEVLKASIRKLILVAEEKQIIQSS
jgi:hypothetical protein